MEQQRSNSNVNNQYRGRYENGEKQRRKIKNEPKRVNKRFAAYLLAGVIGLGTGAVSAQLISNMAENANHAESTREAIVIANTTSKYMKNIRNNVIMKDIITAENMSQLDKLSKAVTTYKQLQYKQGRSLQEEQNYIDACRTICESKDFVIDNYTNVIRAKVATAYGITELDEIANIEIKDYLDIGENQEITHNLMIKLPNGTTINNNGNFFNTTNTMDKKLAEAVIEATSLLNARFSFENQKLEDLPIDRIIKTFEDGIKFESGYDLIAKADGSLGTVKIAQTKDQTKNQIPETEQEER